METVELFGFRWESLEHTTQFTCLFAQHDLSGDCRAPGVGKAEATAGAWRGVLRVGVRNTSTIAGRLFGITIPESCPLRRPRLLIDAIAIRIVDWSEPQAGAAGIWGYHYRRRRSDRDRPTEAIPFTRQRPYRIIS